MNSLAHIEINVANLEKTKRFYDIFLAPLWRNISSASDSSIGYKAPDKTHIFFVQVDEKYTDTDFHRKHIGLNHLAFRVDSIDAVDEMASYLDSKNISLLYADRNRDYAEEYWMDEYYAIFCEDPDRIKVEIVYCK